MSTFFLFLRRVGRGEGAGKGLSPLLFCGEVCARKALFFEILQKDIAIIGELCYTIEDRYCSSASFGRKLAFGKEIISIMGKIISFANQKGGVGKTTSAVNIAASLGVLGYKVLLIDLDPQGNATSGVGIMKKTLKSTVFDLLTTDATAESVILKTPYDNLSVIPANTTLARAEYELGDVENGEFVMKNKLSAVRDRFDYVIIDCPPSLGMLTVNAMSASDGVVIPMQCEFFALEGLSQLMFTISRIKQHYNKELNVTGILVTMHNNRLILSMQVINELKKHYADKLFETTISRNVKVSEAPGFGAPVYYHEKRSKGAIEYMNVAKQLAERI